MSNYASEAGHWYDTQGNPAYTYVNSKGEVKQTSLREARKFGYWPSVSGIMTCAAAPALETWKQDNLLRTAFELGKIDGETFEQFKARVRSAWAEEAAIAPDTGTAIHACIEKKLAGEPYDMFYHPHVYGALETLEMWCGCDGLKSEKSFYHPLGFGGKCDVHKPGFVADFKSKDFDNDLLPKAWDNHAMQLAAYREGFGLSGARCAIIYVSTRVPGLTHLVELDQKELAKGWKLFCALLNYWQIQRDYYPRKETAYV